MPNKYRDTIILIGPCGAGKSTVGEILEKKLNKKFYNLDLYECAYSQQIGLDLLQAEVIKKEKGFFAYYEYCRGFFDNAVEKFLQEYSGNILELGGGHPIVPDAKKQSKIKMLLEPYENSFLVMPIKDKQRSLEILRERNQVTKEQDLNELFLNQDTFFELAKRIIETEGRTPEQTAEDLYSQICQ